eukprot:5977011-Amphidinium_carterae.2
MQSSVQLGHLRCAAITPPHLWCGRNPGEVALSFNPNHPEQTDPHTVLTRACLSLHVYTACHTGVLREQSGFTPPS